MEEIQKKTAVGKYQLYGIRIYPIICEGPQISEHHQPGIHYTIFVANLIFYNLIRSSTEEGIFMAWGWEWGSVPLHPVY